jgi:GNAT superfamily N-acetyltransferase
MTKFTDRHTGVLIRFANVQDIPAIAQVLTQSFYPHSWLRPLWQWGINLDLRLRLVEPSPRYACLVAVVNHQAIASVEICTRSIAIRPWHHLTYPYVFNLAVHPQWRRQGIAKQLLAATEPIARQWGFSQMFIHVLAKNHSALQLYFQFNYELFRQDSSWLGRLCFSSNRLLLYKNLR